MLTASRDRLSLAGLLHILHSRLLRRFMVVGANDAHDGYCSERLRYRWSSVSVF